MFRKFPIVRLKQLRDYPPYLFFYLRRLLYLKWWSYHYANRYKGFTFLSASDSLRYVMDHRLSVIRFGDGEYGQLTGAGEYPPDSDWSQRASHTLIRTLRSLLSLHDPRIFLAHTPPSIFLASTQEAAKQGLIANMHTEVRMYLWKFLRPDQVYGHSSLFHPGFHEAFDWKRFFDFLSDKTLVIVTGGIQQLPNISFGKDVLFVEAGKHDAFERREQILSDVHDVIKTKHLDPSSTLFLISLGPTAGYLVKQLSDDGFIAWDTGHFFKFAHEHWLAYANTR